MKRYKACNLEILKKISDEKENKSLMHNATFSSHAFRRFEENRKRENRDYRSAFSIDSDRILHSLAYTRYIDKTQVFYLIKNDHITHRVLHVQLVSKIGRTIGRFLCLNEDLIEAIALGHDIGHPPFGHDGESFLSFICKQQNIGFFCHSVQGVHFLDRVEQKGRGINLSMQVLDGILCHDGEVHTQVLVPKKNKVFTDFDQEVKDKIKDNKKQLIPMTLEGCVVRLADTIGYIGRDLEDAIRLGIVSKSMIPEKCVKILGDSNGKIVYNLVTDLIINSRGKDYIVFSPKISEALEDLKRFNYEYIYLNKKIKKHYKNIKMLYEFLFELYINDIEKENRESVIFTNYLKNMSESYILSSQKAEIVRDFISGMTDNYFIMMCPEKLTKSLNIF
jgi:dGTPase